jgi:hypothetical protein
MIIEGRMEDKKVVRNLSTIVEELLGADIDPTGPINEGMKKYL